MNNFRRSLLALSLLATFSAAHAQAAASASAGVSATTPVAGVAAEEKFQSRDQYQQQRVEQGLKNGSLSTGEAARIEKNESRIDRLEAHDLKKGPISAQEEARINAAQNRESGQIKAEESNGRTGNPNSRSSRRMQADVARDANQDRRIANGVKDGQLNTRQAARLDRGEAHIDAKEAAAGRNGHVSAGEQASVQRSENHESRRIHRARKNG
jgi:hypothetical protein